MLLVLLCTTAQILQTCFGNPILIATDPRNNEVYIPIIRTFNDLFRNYIFDYGQFLPSYPSSGQPPFTHSGSNPISHTLSGVTSLASDATHAVVDPASKVISGLTAPLQNLPSRTDQANPPAAATETAAKPSAPATAPATGASTTAAEPPAAAAPAPKAA
ncbi:uncharacterized protein LOC103523272 [Diaphorina citri]|uniref:Uncharacterized protein LOC103523272 n=1 Tax=Diaphorina citri TaxID=121845 RepID=A0A1S3DRT6_DIACI|nr:uncharacterized protein LOC103523272 [Diaphorina citri]